jgi:hypothetical protein
MPLTTGDIGACGCGIAFCGCTGLPSTLTLTSNAGALGVFTLNWTGTEYSGSKTFNYPGGTACPATTITLTAEVQCVGGVFQVRFSSLTDLCVGGGGGDICPGTTKATAASSITSTPTVTCSPFNVTWNVTASAAQGCAGVGSYISNLLRNVSGTIVLTP